MKLIGTVVLSVIALILLASLLANVDTNTTNGVVATPIVYPTYEYPNN